MQQVIPLQHVAVCYNVLQCVAMCCSVLQCVAKVLQHILQPHILQLWQNATGHPIAAWCSMLQHVAACCSMLQCVAACCSVFRNPLQQHQDQPQQNAGHPIAVCCSVLQCVAMWCGVLHCVVVCCSVLWCVAVCCIVLQCGTAATSCQHHPRESQTGYSVCCVLQYVAMCCSVAQCVHTNTSRITVHWNTLRLVATHYNTLPHTATHCNTLQHTAIHCNTLQYIATHCNTLQRTARHCIALQRTTSHCNTLPYAATHCGSPQGRSLLQRTATHCNTLHHTETNMSIKYFGISVMQAFWFFEVTNTTCLIDGLMSFWGDPGRILCWVCNVESNTGMQQCVKIYNIAPYSLFTSLGLLPQIVFASVWLPKPSTRSNDSIWACNYKCVSSIWFLRE